MNNTEQIFIPNSSGDQSPSISQHNGTTNEVNTANMDNLSNVCRICATVTELVIPIFTGDGIQNNLAEKIRKYLPIQVSEQDNMPHVVCFQCTSTLMAWHELVKCCVQADVALRSRLPASAINNQASRPELKKIKKEDLESKFRTIVGFVGRRDPPRYTDTVSGLPSAHRLLPCFYCATEIPEISFTDHLVAAHAESLFQCDECNTYVYRRDFVSHMSHHAEQYRSTAIKNEFKKMKKPKEENDEVDKKKIEISKKETPPKSKKKDNDNKERKSTNDFTDHSDTEDGFGPLPESVFEAIEDSQDTRPNGEEASPSTSGSQTISTPPSSETSKPDKIKPHKKPRKCPICSKIYNASSSFFYHMKHYHKKSKDHECDVCGKKYATKANLVQHGYTHHAECRYECKTCGKRFKSKASQYIHEQIHTGVKKHACAQCQRAFRWKTHLVRHMKRHSRDRAHLCAACGRGFNVRGDLLRHARTHSAPASASSASASSAAVACNKCGFKFAQQRYLKAHMLKKHSAFPP